MADQNPNVQAVEVKSICYQCSHCQVMGVEQETHGQHPLTGKPGVFTKQNFMIVCQSKSSFVFAPNIHVLACSSFAQNEVGIKALKMPKPVEGVAVNDTGKVSLN